MQHSNEYKLKLCVQTTAQRCKPTIINKTILDKCWKCEIPIQQEIFVFIDGESFITKC